jgi:hypothetical protein
MAIYSAQFLRNAKGSVEAPLYGFAQKSGFGFDLSLLWNTERNKYANKEEERGRSGPSIVEVHTFSVEFS